MEQGSSSTLLIPEMGCFMNPFIAASLAIQPVSLFCVLADHKKSTGTRKKTSVSMFLNLALCWYNMLCIDALYTKRLDGWLDPMLKGWELDDRLPVFILFLVYSMITGLDLFFQCREQSVSREQMLLFLAILAGVSLVSGGILCFVGKRHLGAYSLYTLGRGYIQGTVHGAKAEKTAGRGRSKYLTYRIN